MRKEGGSAIWGGVTLGLVVGLILGFFVGSSYWKTVLIAVLIGAGAGFAANLLAGVSDLRRRGGSGSTTTITPEREQEILELMEEHFPPTAQELEEEIEEITLADVQLAAQHKGVSTYDYAEGILRDPECPDEIAYKLAKELAVAWREDAEEPGFTQPPSGLVELVEKIIGEPVWADAER